MRARVAAVVLALAPALVVVPRADARADEAGCIAASEKALTLRKAGKLHETLAQLAVCADASCSTEVKAECTQRIAAIDAAMPTLVLAARDGAGNDLFDVHVAMDGAPLAERLDGRPVTADPGAHTFVFEMAGQPPVEKQLVLREGEKDRRESVVLGPPAAPPTPSAADVTPASHGTWGTQKTFAVASGAAGVVGLGLGVAFAAFASSAQSKENEHCSPGACAFPAQAREDYSTARANAVGSTIAFVAGGALVATGVVLWLTAPPGDAAPRAAAWRVAPAFDGQGGRVVVGGAF